MKKGRLENLHHILLLLGANLVFPKSKFFRTKNFIVCLKLSALLVAALVEFGRLPTA